MKPQSFEQDVVEKANWLNQSLIGLQKNSLNPKNEIESHIIRSIKSGVPPQLIVWAESHAPSWQEKGWDVIIERANDGYVIKLVTEQIKISGMAAFEALLVE